MGNFCIMSKIDFKALLKTKRGKAIAGVAGIGLACVTGQLELFTITADAAGLDFSGCVSTIYTIGHLIVGWV